MKDYPYVEAKYRSGKQRPTAIVVRPSWTTSEVGAALGLANRWTQHDVHNSGHFTVDDRQIYRTADIKQVSGTKNGSEKNAIVVAICAGPFHPVRFWDADAHADVLSNLADLLADIISETHIRSRLISEHQFNVWRRHRYKWLGGIYIHVPGTFPEDEFMSMLNERIQHA